MTSARLPGDNDPHILSSLCMSYNTTLRALCVARWSLAPNTEPDYWPANLTATKPMKEQISLYYREGSSDKVYHANLDPKGNGWIVNFAFGRRGSTLQTGTKTSEPLAYDKAKKIYDKIVAEKMAKGYTPAAGGTPYVGTENAGKVSGLLPQLLNMIGDAELELLLNDSEHCGQEKFDGRHIMDLIEKQQGVGAGSLAGTGARQESISKRGGIAGGHCPATWYWTHRGNPRISPTRMKGNGTTSKSASTNSPRK